MREYDRYYDRPRVKVKAIDRRKQQGWMLWAAGGAFFLACGMMFFFLTF